MVGMEPPSRMKIGRIRVLGVVVAVVEGSACCFSSGSRSGFVFCGSGFGSRFGAG